MSKHDLSSKKPVTEKSSRADSSTTVSEHRAMHLQVIEGRYIDQKKLVEKLKSIHGTNSEGKNNFEVEMRLNRYTIWAPMDLSERDINDCC